MSDAVKAQYEAYPYPRRDPRDEARRLVVGSPSHLAEVDHYLFAGRRDWRRPFRALVAGGGTGDGLIMLAQHLKDRGAAAEVHYLDLSTASRAIAEARARARGLDFIRFHTGSLLDVGSIAPGPYDYIDSCGVLHHLPDPPAGLAALKAELAPDGGMGLMVYAEYGRSGVYEMQEAFRLLGRGLDPQGQVQMAKRVLRGVAGTNRLARNPFLTSHKTDDNALYDLLLHSTDRAYRVAELLDFLSGAGLAPAALIEPARYEPAHYLGDEAMRRRAADLAQAERWALAEALAGSLKTHVVYAVTRERAGTTVAAPAPDAVPVWRDGDGATFADALRNDVLTTDFDGHPVRFALPQGSAPLIRAIDGRRSLGEIADLLGQDWARFDQRFARVYEALNGLNLLLLTFRT